VAVQVLRADGGVLGACINAAMLAAADAGDLRGSPACRMQQMKSSILLSNISAWFC
jgi:ribonuclease PH